jgi:hypothetical protein
MSKVRVLDGKLQRDSSPLFFPAYWPTSYCVAWWLDHEGAMTAQKWIS